ncbi:hypothetical protein ACHAQE_006539 [Botrytis cinerea]
MLATTSHGHGMSSTSSLPTTQQLALGKTRIPKDSFVIEFPNIDKTTMPYIHHFVGFCTRFLAYANDDEGNPFKEELVPFVTTSPALLHSIIALAAGHMSRTDKQHEVKATKHYSMALRELNTALCDNSVAKQNATLGACLLLCVYEISHSDRGLWLEHLKGARDLILHRGGPKTSDFLTRFFALLDVSGSLWAGQGPLLPGNYWLEDAPSLSTSPKQIGDSSSPAEPALNWPYYDPGGVMTGEFHVFMIFMAKLSRLSSRSLVEKSVEEQIMIKQEALGIQHEVQMWWQNCPSMLRDLSNDWRRQPRDTKLTVAETLEAEAFSSTKACMYGCILFIHHIINPVGEEPPSPEVLEAITQVLDIAAETPEGYGLEMGLYYGLFAAGASIFNDWAVEDTVRKKLKADTRIALYHADRALELLEILWRRQHQYERKFDWREVQQQMGIHMLVAKDCRELDRTPQPDFGKMDRNELKGTDVGLKNDGTYKATILLLGGTGKVARRIAPLLSVDGYNVLLASRSGSSPASLPNTKGVEFDWLDTNSYDNPFITSKGDDDAKENLVDAVFMIAPPVLDALPLAKKFIDGVIKRGVRRIVFLSGSIQHCGDGPILSQISEYIKGKGRKYRDDGQIPNNPDPNAVEWTILRPSWFMENFSEMHHRYTIRDENRLVSATGRGKIPFVSAEDIANVAYKALIGWRSNTFEKGLVDMELVLKGAELWAYDDVALLLTELLGRKISHVHVREEEIVKGMVEGGVEDGLARVLGELDGAVRRGEEAWLGGDLEAVIGGRGRGVRGFVEECVRGRVWDL